MKNICNTCKYEIYEFCKKVGLESIDKNGKCLIYKEKDVYKEHGLRKVEVIEINRYRELDSDTPNNKSFIAYFHKWFESENELYAIVEDTKGNVEKLNAFDFNFKFINI